MFNILTVDGIDGVGKATITALLEEQLHTYGWKTIRISPPFYDTPTGGLITEYLHSGYRYITDRMVISDLYAMDRNMWMREHFDMLVDFEADEYPVWKDDEVVLIYDRSWMSNLFYQTALLMQDKVEERWLDLPVLETPSPIRTYHLNMGDLLRGRKTFPEEMFSISEKKLCNERIRLVHNAMRHGYDVELRPWRAVAKRCGREFVLSLTDAALHVTNIVLDPGSIDVIEKNLKKRYKGDSSKKDLNEKSTKYLESVLENMYWIHNYWCDITEPNVRYADRELSDLNPLSHSIVKAYQYNLVKTTHSDGVQKKPKDIVKDIQDIIFR